jgi:predicted enzyme related to lactoylglutathione lyase
MQPFAFALAEPGSSADGVGGAALQRVASTQSAASSDEDDGNGARQLRVVVNADDFDVAVGFYRNTLGLAQEEAFEAQGGARVVILQAGRATLELANQKQVTMIDDVEVGRPVSPHIRIAFEVEDTKQVTDRLVAQGAELIAAPVETPWRSLNSRLKAPAGLQLTIFEELEKS